jgi:hypothetical protein
VHSIGIDRRNVTTVFADVRGIVTSRCVGFTYDMPSIASAIIATSFCASSFSMFAMMNS